MQDVLNIRNYFPGLSQKVHGKPLVYFDNAATTHRLQSVIDAYSDLIISSNGNVHRSPHYLGQMATKSFENTRDKVQEFIHAKHRHEIIFTRGTTEAINLVAFSYGETFINEGDEIIVSEMEHHSNIVPWQMMCERKGAILKVIPFDDEGNLLLDEYDSLLTERTKLVAVTAISNVLGTINPIEKIIEKAHRKGAHVLIDGAQAIVHKKINIQEINCDFFAFSAHKMYGPTGVGVLYGKEDLLEQMQPYQGGGEMISEVTFKETTYGNLPTKFEAGTPDFTSVASFSKAIDFINSIDLSACISHENKLLRYAEEKLKNIEGIMFYGTSANKASLLSFTIEGMHPFDTATLIDKLGFAIRTGRMCADPIMDHYGVQSMMRISFAPYNTFEEIDQFYVALLRIREMFS
ncbi:cysteine desulfurase/selenocysteine lyase [Balneicella halophila]|uniref:Cysteine desulfurase n=1 Tax=Balneicella halophila TaxID=1537566 RepID=A0A7L4UQ36_BALHA|nr:SufS family cysteine desulfurase [Balneicella halophila]PVX51895.1 cysteine desulfurase/selenocysteine lyase [Balneicella halophila]